MSKASQAFAKHLSGLILQASAENEQKELTRKDWDTARETSSFCRLVVELRQHVSNPFVPGGSPWRS